MVQIWASLQSPIDVVLLSAQMNLFLFRHGQTAATLGDIFCGGKTDSTLTDEGLAQAKSLATHCGHLALNAIYASSQTRAQQTALPLATQLSLPVQTDPRLRELEYGAWDGKPVVSFAGAPDYQAFRQDPQHFGPPGGETAAQVGQRAMAAIADLYAQHPGQNVAVFTHKATKRTILCGLLGLPFGHYKRRFGAEVCGLSVLRLDGPDSACLLHHDWPAHRLKAPDFF